MSSLNKVMLIGRLGSKPEMRKTASGDAVARLRLATDRVWNAEGRQHKDTEWHDVAVFGKLAETCGEYLDTGRLVFVEGRIKSHTWEDNNGAKRLSREVVARRVDFLGPRPQPADPQAA